MRALLPLLFGLVASCSAPTPTQRQQIQAPTIVSSNPCIDAILVELVEPARILSISHYSQSIGASSMNIELARRFPSNGGTAEEIIALRPDIVLLGSHTSQATIAALRRAGIEPILISVPNNIAESLEQIDQIAIAVGGEDGGSALKSRIEKSLDAAPTESQRPRALIWQAGGLVPGNGTLIDDILSKAGFDNASADYGLAMWDILPLEPVASNPPDMVFSPTSAKSGEHRNIALRQQFFSQFGDEVALADIPENLLHCGGPTIIRAMNILKRSKLDMRGDDS
ncbi:hypothetical protein MNBD_ALPHA04-1489 [hydrothermal vent metagenome]|uniref:Fe/B12 periplasmic-binding domain-containing protein n=1 Tax=hydrothermal vent metagenome TaxID=652676 RepID=A0A3B0RDA5_9ZZZZ